MNANGLTFHEQTDVFSTTTGCLSKKEKLLIAPADVKRFAAAVVILIKDSCPFLG